MAITGTPVVRDAGDNVLLNVRVPVITEVYGEQVWQKRRAVRMVEGQCAWLQANLISPQGKLVNLENYGLLTSNPQAEDASISSSITSAGSSTSSSSSAAATVESIIGTAVSFGDTSNVVVRFREATLRESEIYEVDALVVDPVSGLVRALVPSQVAGDSGVYTAEFGVLDSDSQLIFTNAVYLLNEVSGWGTTGKARFLPSLDDIRLSLRDNDPADNLLLDTHDFDLAEICHAITRTVVFWNDQPPPVRGAIFTTKTFPFRDIWLDGIHLFLFQIAEEHYRRNRLPHSAGGTQIDDKSKHPDYKAAWKERYSEFVRKMKHRKVQLNAAGGYSSSRSGYSLYYDHTIG